MKRHLALAWLLLGLALMLIPFTVFLNTSASDSISRAVAPGLARLGDRATVHAEGRATPRMNLADAREVPTVYTGEPELQRLLRENMVQPLAMASGDFDEDGMPDLISAYAGPAEGIITLHRGNVDAMFPNSPEANQRKNRGEFTDAPFLEQARVFRSPERPDFVGAGDFDADGHWDVVTASRGSRAVYLLKGDGQGGLIRTRDIELSGTVTTLITGEVNRADGLVDLIVGIQAIDGPKALVFEGPEGALASVPETFSLPAQASSLALGRFDNDYLVDLAIGAGRYLVVAYGRDRKLSIGEMARHQAREATIIKQAFPYDITSIVAGDFAGGHEEELAIRSSDGNVRLVESKGKGRKWAGKTLRQALSPDATLLVKARLSSSGKDDLLALDSSSQQFHTIVSGGEIREHLDSASLPQTISVDGEPLAVLPMKLNGDALTDLVTMKRGRSAPSILLFPAVMTFTVTDTTDGLGFPSLRQAIMDANTTPGPDLIVFNITPPGPKTIQILTALPTITEAVTIDGTTQPGFAGTPIIELAGGPSPAGTNGLLITAGNSIVKGLVINRFSGSGYGIRLQGGGGNTVEGNYIGTDINGNAALPNGRGIFVNGAPNNQIGGTTAAARNVISGNTGNGVDIQGSNAFGNIVQGNFIGTNAAGTAALGNGGTGISVQIQAMATIGGTTAGAGNVISANVIGIGFGAVSGNLVQGNLIGTDVNGIADLGNVAMGVQVTTASPNNTFGGTTAAARNIVSGNNVNGFQIRENGTNGNIVQGNFIGTQSNGVSPLGNGLNGVSIENAANNNTVGGASVGAGNVIAFNGGDGVAMSGGTGNPIGVNSIFSNTRLGIDLNDDNVVTPNDVCDSDLGANELQNFPVLTSANSVGNLTIIAGTLNSTTGTTFRIEFFSSAGCDPSNNGEGQTFIGFTNVATPAAVCDVPINVTVLFAVPAGQVVTATATDPANNTSEFSQCVTVTAGVCTINCPPNQTSANDPNQCGAVVTYPLPNASAGCGTVTCSPASGSFFPRGTTTVTCTTGGGPSCSFTVTVNDTQPPTITCPPNQTVAGSAPTVVNYPAPTVSDNCPGATAACVPPSGSTFPPGTTPVNCNATDASANTAACTFTVTVTPCTIACPADLIVGTGPNATQCSSNVTYQAPTTLGACGPVTCGPPSGSVFAVGTTTVSCTTNVGPSCSFSVTVVDDTPPTINCSTGVTAPLPAGQLSAVVNYPAATATDNCTVASVVCVPASGSPFPVGATLVTCTATDASANANLCFFFVTVLDAEAPVIRCPANVSAALPSGQTSAVVNYPPPTVTDNLPGVNVVCVPASGSSFPAGSTTVTCTATDAGGNKSSCSFIVGVGGPQAKVTIAGNKTSLEFAAAPKRKPPKPKNNPCAFFTVENVGFAPLVLTFDSIARTGSSVDSGRITDPNDTRFFSLSRVNADQSLTPLDIGAVLTLQPGQVQNLCARFAALIPALAGKTTGLAASNVLPDAVTSKIVFRQNAGANLAVPILARVSTALVLVNLSNPRAPAEVLFTRSGNDITVSYAVFDSNLDVSRARYEFLDSSGQVIAGPFEIDLAASISSANLLRGQSFSVEQRFTGASSNPEITSVRLTVFDGETSVGAPSTSSATSTSAASVQLMNRARRVTLYLPDVKLR